MRIKVFVGLSLIIITVGTIIIIFASFQLPHTLIGRFEVW
jgi:hypothetical protein